MFTVDLLYLTVCDANHVRAWSVTRVNGHISSDAGIEAIGSFTIASLNGSHPFYHPINAIGTRMITVHYQEWGPEELA